MLRSFSIYTVTSVLTAGMGFLLMPFLSHYLEPEGMGVMSLFNTYVMIMAPLMSVVAYGLITVEYYQLKDRVAFGKLFSSIQIIPLIGFLLFFLPSVFFNSELSAALELEHGNGLWLLLLPVFSLLSTYNEVFLGYLVIQQKPGFFAIVSITRTILEISLTILFVAVFGWGWEGRLYAWLIVIFLIFLFGLFYFKKEKLLNFSINWHYVRAGLLFGFPLLLHTIGKFIINQSDRIFIAKMVSLEEAGIYNVGYQIGSIILILATAFNSSYTPFLFERLSNTQRKSEKEIVRMSLGFIVLLLIALVCMTVLAPWFFRIFMDKRYAGGTKYVFWTGLAYWFWAIYMVFAAYLFYFKKTKFLAFLAVFNVIVNIVLNYFLIRQFGALGAAYATAISFFLVMVIVFFKAQKIYPINYLQLISTGKDTKAERISKETLEGNQTL